MIKIITFLMLFLVGMQLHAKATFWEELTTIEDELSIHDETNTTVSDSNVTSGDKSKVIEIKFARFNQIIDSLKENPYEVEQGSRAFFNENRYPQEVSSLKAKISINRQYGYDVAVLRDKLALELLNTQSRAYYFMNDLAKNWTENDLNATITKVQEFKKYLDGIDLKKYHKQIKNLAITSSSEMGKKVLNTYDILEKNVLFFKDFLNYLSINPTIIQYQSIASKLQLISIINYINTFKISENINIYLRHIHLDVGRLSIFLVVIVFFTMLSYLVYNSIYNFIRTLILNKEDVLDDLLLLNLEKLRKPILLIVIIFGFELGLEVLFYPSHLVHAELWFYIAYLFIITYSAIILADNFFFELFFIRKNIKNKEMRRELINLMISVIKLTFILIAVLLLLIHLDVNITGIIASLGIGGLAVALAAKDTLSNFFGLIKIIVDNSFSQGDWIQSDTIEGTVVEIGFISTKIRTFDNALMTIPNASLANGILKNWNRRKVGRRIKMHITLEYSSSREDVQNAINDIYEMLQKHPHIVSPAKIDSEAISKLHKARKLISTEDKYGIKSTLLVYLDRFSDSSIDILVYSFSNTVNWKEWLEIKQDVHFKIWEIVEANNLNFAFPSQSIYLQNSSK